MGMTIDETTAQLILDAIAWSNHDWYDACDWQISVEDEVSSARADFVRFCRARGIDNVERVVGE